MENKKVVVAPKEIENIVDLRDSLLDSFNALKGGSLDLKTAKELTNLSGKIILSARVELDYIKYNKEERKITFLDAKK
jgi:hypothetical protein